MVFVGGLLMTQLFSGCASDRTTHTQTSVAQADVYGEPLPPPDMPASTVETNQTTTTTEVKQRGLIGSVFHGIGAVLAFPFELVANIIKTIL